MPKKSRIRVLMNPLPDLDDLVVANTDQPLRDLISDEEGRVRLAPMPRAPGARRSSLIDWAAEVEQMLPSVRAAMDELSQAIGESGLGDEVVTERLREYRDRYATGGMVPRRNYSIRAADPEAVIVHTYEAAVAPAQERLVTERVREYMERGIMVRDPRF